VDAGRAPAASALAVITPVLISVEDLRKSYDGQVAVRALSFAVGPGEVLGLVGPNGAGKTTTLRCLAGIVVPSAGRVAIAGIDLREDPVAAKRALAFVPDEPALFDYLTVDEHLRFIARLYGVADAAERIPPLLAELELSHKRGALPGELSRGMRQKLAIACALLHDPRVLLLDEPLTGLDPAGIRRMKATIRDRARAGNAVVLSSHLLHLVEELCTRLLVVHRGRAVAHGTMEEIVAARPELAGLSLEDVFVALTSEDDAAAGRPTERGVTERGTPAGA
jgi:ABC-2 type transport system ATP-binding protein